MADVWYYENQGKAIGPINGADLDSLQRQNQITDETLVWNEALGEGWKRFGETDFAAKRAASATPKAAFSEPEVSLSIEDYKFTAPASVQQDQITAIDFLNSKVVKDLIGKNSDYYLKKWKKALGGNDFSFSKAQTAPSFNFAAFLFPFAWPFYRKLWLLGAITLGVMIFSVVIFTTVLEQYSKIGQYIGYGLSGVWGVLGNGLYLHATREKFEKISLAGDDESQIAALGGVSIIGALLSYAAINAVIAATVYFMQS